MAPLIESTCLVRETEHLGSMVSVLNTAKPTKSGYQMAAEEKQFQWRCHFDAIAMDLKVIWGRSNKFRVAAIPALQGACGEVRALPDRHH